jgi:hypothetical protein
MGLVCYELQLITKLLGSVSATAMCLVHSQLLLITKLLGSVSAPAMGLVHSQLRLITKLLGSVSAPAMGLVHSQLRLITNIGRTNSDMSFTFGCFYWEPSEHNADRMVVTRSAWSSRKETETEPTKKQYNCTVTHVQKYFSKENLTVASIFLILIVGGGAQLDSFGTAATKWPIVPDPGDYDAGKIGGMIGRGNRSTRRKPAPGPLVHDEPHMLPVREPGPPRWEVSV